MDEGHAVYGLTQLHYSILLKHKVTEATLAQQPLLPFLSHKSLPVQRDVKSSNSQCPQL